VATSRTDLRDKLARARESLSSGETVLIQDSGGIYLTEQPLAQQGKVAFLFPGQGSQYPNMLRDLVTHFSELREAFELADRTLVHRFPQLLSRYVYPPEALDEEERNAQTEALTQTTVAQPALGAAEMGVFHLLGALGVQPDMAAGHSYGEYVALCAAGVFDEVTLLALSEARGSIVTEVTLEEPGAMAAVRSGPTIIAQVVDSIDGVWMSNLNAPNQTVISGTEAAVGEAMARLKAQGVRSVALPVSYGSHSPLMASARELLAEHLSGTQFASPRMAVFSNTLAAPYPCDPAAVPSLLADHLLRPVEFVRQIEAMYEAGARIFVEVGPRSVVTGLVRRILGERRYLAVATDVRNHSCLLQLHHLLAQLAAHGVRVMLDRLYEAGPVGKLN
jgi:acyl transferase domain-containing protein